MAFSDTPSWKSIGLVASGAFFISFSSVFVVTANVGPSISAFYRMLFGGVILLAITLWRTNSLYKGGKPLVYAFLSALFISVDLIAWHQSILYIGPGLATILANFQVFFLGLVGILYYKEHPSKRLFLAIPLALGGLFLLVGIDWSRLSANYKTGLLLALFAAFNYAFYILFLRHSQMMKNRFSVFANMALISLMAAALMGGYTYILGHESFVIPDLESWGSLLGLGIACQVIGWVLLSRGLSGLDASVGGLLLLMQPALAFIWDILFFNRPTSSWELLGAAITLAAIYLGMTGRTKVSDKR